MMRRIPLAARPGAGWAWGKGPAALPALPWLAGGLLAGGIIVLAGGVLLLVIPIRRASR
jgi:hypothetical protein